MSIVGEVLTSKYNVKPTHTSSEIASLAQKFPENIKLFAAYRDEIMSCRRDYLRKWTRRSRAIYRIEQYREKNRGRRFSV